jgi:hypothetical protein
MLIPLNILSQLTDTCARSRRTLVRLLFGPTSVSDEATLDTRDQSFAQDKMLMYGTFCY